MRLSSIYTLPRHIPQYRVWLLALAALLSGCGTPDQVSGPPTAVNTAPTTASVSPVVPTSASAVAGVPTVAPTRTALPTSAPNATPDEATALPQATSLPLDTTLPFPTIPPIVPLPASERRIAFISMHEGHNELYLIHADGTALTRLTHSAEDKRAPAWSVDGQWIAFEAISHEGHQSNLYKIRPDGSQLTRLTDTPTRDSFPAWSSDGQWIAFSSNNDEPYSKNPSPRKFYQIPADGGERTPLDTSNPATVAQFLLASANGQFLLDWALLTRPEGGWNDLVHQMDETLQIPQIAWVPDMRQLAYTTYRDGNAEIYVINTDGSGRRRLTNDPAKEEFPVWSPDGQRIAFLSSVQGQGESIDLINADGSGHTRLVEAAHAQKLAWSPDGQFLAYNADGPIIVIRADGSQVARIPVVAAGFAWEPR